jgi:hypothetical protein
VSNVFKRLSPGRWLNPTTLEWIIYDLGFDELNNSGKKRSLLVGQPLKYNVRSKDSGRLIHYLECIALCLCNSNTGSQLGKFLNK